MDRRGTLALFAVIVLAFSLKVELALNTYGSNDVIIWQAVLAKVKAEGALAWYRDGVTLYGNDGHLIGVEVSNHPPLALRLVAVFDILGRETGLPFGFWLRFAASLADIAAVFLLRAILARSHPASPNVSLLLVAASPVSIMISGFHGNTDPIMICLLLLSIWLAQSRQAAFLAGAAFGLAMSIKIMPIVFAPVFLLSFSTAKQRLGFVLSSASVFVAGCLPYLLQNPMLVLTHVFGYSPQVEAWGIPGLGHIFFPRVFDVAYGVIGKVLLLAVLLVASFRMNRSRDKPALFSQCGLIAFLFLFFATGFSVQYLAWLVPWGAGAGRRQAPFYYFVSSAFLFTVYTVWSAGFPWYFANSLEYAVSFWPGLAMFSLEVACWISIGIAARGYWRTLLPKVPTPAIASPAARR